MKQLVFYFYILLLFSCDGENAPDCLKTAGATVTEVIELADFDKITVFERVELIVSQSNTTQVILETGENLKSDVRFTVEDGRLLIRNENSCNLVRDYGITKVYVSTPNITEIRNSSGLTVSSRGVLTFNNLRLLSENYNNSAFHSDGSFDLTLNVQTLSIITNTYAHLFLDGTVNDMNINFASGDSRLEARNLIAQHITIYHRSSNDMLITPMQSVKGIITAPGNVIAFNKPPIIDVDERYTGRLIFKTD